MFRFGMGELIVILIIILVLFGSKKLPELAKSIGKSIDEFKKARSAVKNEIDDIKRDDDGPSLN